MASDSINFKESHTEIAEQTDALRSTRDEEIKRRAYELYLERGAQPDLALEDWLQAEREITAEKRRVEATGSEPSVASCLIDSN